MRTHIVGVVLASTILFAAQTSHAQAAQSDRPVQWGFMGGGVGVTGDYRGILSTGVVGGLLVQWPMEPRHLTFRADLMYHWISDYHRGCGHSIEGGSAFCGSVDTWSRVVSGSFSVVARLNDPKTGWSPYAIGGVAAYLTGNNDEPLVERTSPSHFGFQGGVGLEWRRAKHTTFLEIRYLTMGPAGLYPVTMGWRW